VNDLWLGAKLAGRALRAGEFTLLAVALALAVAAMATVGLFTDRMRLALDQEANRLLGGDLVLDADRPLPQGFEAQARSNGLASTATVGFRSMVVKGEGTILTEVTAVGPGYPLRGSSRIAASRGAPDRVPADIPPSGQVWADERLLSQLGLQVGDRIELGERPFVVAAVLTRDPGLAVSFLGLGPRLVMNAEDLAATGLIQPGSRARYRLLVAGQPQQVAQFREWATPRIVAGQRVEGVRDSRPEIRSALERAERFMGLAALATVALATVAVLLAARRFHERHLDMCAMLRCLGAGEWRVFRLQLVQLLLVGGGAAGFGWLAGLAGQLVLGRWLQGLIGVELPPPSVAAGLHAASLGMLLLLAFALPPMLGLRKVPALRVLRRDVPGPRLAGFVGYATGIAAIAGLVLWQARDPRLGIYVLAGCLATVAVSAILTRLLLAALAKTGHGTGVTWRYGLASLRRRPAATHWQVMALGLGLMALLTLTLIRSDLLASWRGSLPPDAPNRFLINVQPDQVEEVGKFLAAEGIAQAALHPMVRARLTAINGRQVSSTDYEEERAKRLVDREFNLSWAIAMQPDNVLVRGRWWDASERAAAQLSVEDGIARTLGIALGDQLTYDVAGTPFTARVTSLRKVEWDSFRANFFVVGTPGLLEPFPATYISNFHVPAAKSQVLNALVKRFPNIVVIDIGAILGQVQAMIGQVAGAVQFVFLFTLAAGLLVLYAGIAATHDERMREAAIMRTLGANRGQVARAHAAEFAIIGALAGLLGAGGASGLGYFIGTRLLNLDYQPDFSVWLFGTLAGTLCVTATGLLFTRKVLATPPLATLRSLG
jgi:putative ABC transport system permease protein